MTVNRSDESGARISSFIHIGITSFIVWIALVYFPAMSLKDFGMEAAAGLIVALVVALLTWKKADGSTPLLLHPKRLAYMLVFGVVFIWEMIKANLHMAKVVLSPTLPIHPGIVEIKTQLKPSVARLLLGNAITLTPGTMTMEIDDDKLYIHWIEAIEDREKAGDIIKGSFEKWLGGVFS